MVAMAETTSTKVLKLKSSDDEVFEMEEKVALQSETIKNMVEDGLSEDVIPLFNVEGKTLAKIVEWLKKHAINDDEVEKEELKKWDADFFEIGMDDLYDMIMASNYLGIKVLLDQTAEKVASIIRGKRPAEVRKIFNIKNDFSPEEEEQIRRENGWQF